MQGRNGGLKRFSKQGMVKTGANIPAEVAEAAVAQAVAAQTAVPARAGT